MAVATDNPDLELLQQGQQPDPAEQGLTPSVDNQDNQVQNNQVQNNQPQPVEVEDTTEDDLKYLADLAEKEDLDYRFPMLLRARRNEWYFNNVQKIVYDEVARDYRTLDDIMQEIGNLPGAADIKINNIYRAYAESLIAALSVATPATEFTPDDAQSPDDVETAEAYTNIEELISRHNEAQVVLIKTLTILFNQGVVAGFNFAKSDADFGMNHTYKGSKSKQVPVVDIRCQQCAELLDVSVPVAQFNPKAPIACRTCDYVGTPQPYQVMENIEEPEYDHTPKSRSLYDVFGCTAVKLPLYAKKQSDCGYLILRIDDHIAKFKAVYDSEGELDLQPGSGDSEKYERWARLSLAYSGAIPQHITTARLFWMRPWYYYNLEDIDRTKALLDKYPKGVMVTMIGDDIVDLSHEKLDDCWTLTFDPTSNFIHAEPDGNALVPMQDVENDLFNLGVQTIQYGISETFVNPKTVNLQAYSKSPSAPGMLTKALPPGPNLSLADGFHTLKPATLTSEYSAFTASVTAKTQFATGAFPSIFGGNMGDKGSNTATEYTESRARALQRLQLTWVMVASFWGKMTMKAVQLFIRNMAEDEQYSKKQKGTFVNVYISKASLNGRVGLVEPEVNGQLPQSWAQKKDFLMNLIEMNIPEIGSILLHPNNSELLKTATGMTGLYIPGEKDFEKQSAEYYELSIAAPIDDHTSSVPIDIDVDDHPAHMAILKNKLVSKEGMYLYKTNPAGYQNCIAHYREHEMAQQAKTMQMSGMTAQNQPAETAVKSAQG